MNILNSCYAVSRLIFILHFGKIPDGMKIDHFNGNRVDNNISNLRCVTQTANSQNAKLCITNTSGVKGVYSRNKRRNNGNIFTSWVAVWYEDGRLKHKSFAETKYVNARELAIEYRNTAIEKLNENGAQYTLRHTQS